MQGAERLHTVVGELHATKTFRSRGDKDVAERRRGETVIDKKILPAVFVLTGRHTLDSDKQVVQSSRTGQTHLLRRVEKRCVRLVQDTLGILDIEILQEMLRRNPCPFFENPLKMERTHMHRFGYGLQTGLLLAVILYEPDGFGNPAIIQFVLCFFHRITSVLYYSSLKTSPAHLAPHGRSAGRAQSTTATRGRAAYDSPMRT